LFLSRPEGLAAIRQTRRSMHLCLLHEKNWDGAMHTAFLQQ
jgi:hypothetical protein